MSRRKERAAKANFWPARAIANSALLWMLLLGRAIEEPRSTSQRDSFNSRLDPKSFEKASHGPFRRSFRDVEFCCKLFQLGTGRDAANEPGFAAC